MEYKSHFTGEKTKAAEDHGTWPRGTVESEPMATDFQNQGAADCTFCGSLRSHALVSLPHVQALATITQVLAHPQGAGAYANRQNANSAKATDIALP